MLLNGPTTASSYFIFGLFLLTKETNVRNVPLVSWANI